MQDELIQLRSYLHRHPELSNQEFQTTKHLVGIIERLSLNCNVANEERGFTCDITSTEQPARRLALRADLDALPLQDAKQVDYRSTHDNAMHACGHDVHATILVGAIRVLESMRKNGQLPWPIGVRAIFQPAEETATGASYMINNASIENVNEIVALHVDPTRKVGRIGLSPGVITANCDLFEVRFKGQGGHGARPHETIDPIDVATQWLQQVYATVRSGPGPSDSTVISVGAFQAGHSANVIPDEALLSGTLRSHRRDARQTALKAIHEISHTLTNQTGCKIEWRLGFSAPSVVNDTGTVAVIKDAARKLLGSDAIEPIGQPSMGGEDFSYYLEHIPGAMFRIGSSSEQIGKHPLHSPNFDIDERVIAIGVKLLVATVIEYFDPARA